MAKLFPVNRLRELAAEISTDSIKDKVEIAKLWHTDYHYGSLKTDKETSREQQYNQDFFVKILGYVEKPMLPYSLEPKASTHTRDLPDAILGYFPAEADCRIVNAVVELKGASVDLDRPQGRSGRLSPVQQAFKYRPLYRDCDFVVVSNFFEFRLYHDNQLDFESWTLDDLVDSNNDYILFKTWYLLLNAENLTNADGPSKTARLLRKIKIEQEEIGQEFYSEYSAIRTDLVLDILQNNREKLPEAAVAVEKAQKLLDRTVFACFAEDKGLLPDDSTHLFVESANTSFLSFWDNLKGFFEAINEGSEKLRIPTGYNGGLFANDVLLNRLSINESVLRRLTDLARYDFNEDLGVTILGRIFEQSVTDLEDIKAAVQADDGTLTSIRHSKRKHDGIYYTPDYIVRYIVDQTVGEYLRQTEEAAFRDARVKQNLTDQNFRKREAEAYRSYQQVLQDIRVVDPACGSGAFLVHVFDYLMAENERVGSVLGDLFSTNDFVRHVLRTNIHGVDKNEESVEITKLSLWLKSASRNEKLTSLDANIKPGNSLIEDPSIDRTQAFSWHDSFPTAMANGGFDVVVGNPPYVDSETMTLHAPEERKYLASRYETARGNWDLYIPFTEKGLSLLRSGGFFGFIIPNKVLSVSYASTLRSWVNTKFNLRELVDVSQMRVFEQADIYPVILIIANESGSDELVVTDSIDPVETRQVPRDIATSENWAPYLSRETGIRKKLEKFEKMGDYISFHSAGSVSEAYDLIPHIVTNSKPAETHLKIINTGLIDPFSTSWATDSLQYIKNKYRYPCAHKDDLPRKPWLNSARIIFAGMAIRIEAFPDPDQRYFAAKSTVVAAFENVDELYYVQALLSSGLFSSYLQNEFSSESMAGGYINVSAQKLGQLPYIPYDTANTLHNELRDLAQQLHSNVSARDETLAKTRNYLEATYGYRPPRGQSQSFLRLPFASNIKRFKKPLDENQKMKMHHWFEEQSAALAPLEATISESYATLNSIVEDAFLM